MASKNLQRSTAFGPFPQAPNHQVMNSWQNYFMTTDATGTPITSPVDVANNADTVLTVPAAAVQLVLISSTALRVSESSPASEPYFVIPANTLLTVPCMTPGFNLNDATGQIFLRADASAAVVSFMFLNV
jgi:hypothetical protein